MPAERPGDVWMEYAQVDLRVLLRLSSEPVEPVSVCFHAQQAVEKALKAILAALGEDPPRTHDLGALMDRIPVEWRAISEFPQADSLTRWASDPRYPFGAQRPTLEDAAAAGNLARAFVAAVERDLAKYWAAHQHGDS